MEKKYKLTNETIFYRNKGNGVSVQCGCFNGSIEVFQEAVNETHGDNGYGEIYRAAIEMAKKAIKLY